MLCAVTRALLALSALAFVACSDSGDGERRLTTSLTGATEIPGPGDPDGTGTATIILDQGKGTLCYELSVSGIGAPNAAHIHAARAGTAGPVLVTLATPSNGTSTGCVEGAGKTLVKRLADASASYYVNVHNAEYPDGALRGQLGK